MTPTTPSDTDGTEIPAPDPDPLDCNGHGSHVAGTAAGFGVKSDHTTYTGPYNSTTYSTSFGIGPGVAPKAKLVSLKVFGCEGATDVLTDALEWVGDYNATHADAIDVVNMSHRRASAATTPRMPRPATRWSHRASSSSPRPATRAPTRT